MGIRVVQRAAAPPAPYLYNLMGTQNEHKQRNKNMQKKSLFNPKSTPLQPNATIDSLQNINRSPIHELKKTEVNKSGNNLAETEFDNVKTQTKNDISSKIEVIEHLAEECEEKENKEETVSPPPLLDTLNSNKTPSHVSFKDQMVNGENVDEHKSADAHKPDENLKAPDEKHIEVTMSADLICRYKIDFFQKHENKNTPPCGGKRPSLAAFLAQVPPPHATVEKPFLLSDGCVMLEASLDKAIYSHGEEVLVTLQIRNYSNKTVKRIKVNNNQQKLIQFCLLLVCALYLMRKLCSSKPNHNICTSKIILPINSFFKLRILILKIFDVAKSNLLQIISFVIYFLY